MTAEGWTRSSTTATRSAPDARAVLCVEAKVTGRETDALVAGMVACGGEGGPETHVDAVRRQLGWRASGWASNHHKKCLALVALRPELFWAVSRDKSHVFEVSNSPGRFELSEVPEARLAVPSS